MSTYRERPILFSGEMVRAILAGQKTQTRRLVKGASGAFWDHAGWTPSVEPDGVVWTSPGHTFAMTKRCPYGKPGDRLWVRETWASADRMYQDHDLDVPGVVAYFADKSAIQFNARPPRLIPAYDLASWNWDALQKRPCLHMPRWASRILLEVTEVRVEQLQDISVADALAEGCVGHDPEPASEGGTIYAWHGRSSAPCPRAHFMWLWDRLNGTPWSSNPWVWCVTFRRLGAS